MSALNGPCVKPYPHILCVINLPNLTWILGQEDNKAIFNCFKSFRDRLHFGFIVLLASQRHYLKRLE